MALAPGRLITLWVSSPDTHSERRLGTDLTISQLKVSRGCLDERTASGRTNLVALQLKLEPVTGISYAYQVLTLQRTNAGAGHSGAGAGPGEKEVLAELSDDNRTLESYGVKELMTIRVSSVIRLVSHIAHRSPLSRSTPPIPLARPSAVNSPTSIRLRSLS